ncbi:hypothetical protein [Solimonas sp. SE-A11]|uniref:hypothetical protein n=1 Tax=Solimonas sp. SE-A11 TaxID=3054954 RepID=UPI00259D0713|nr:hypothetical protein [Solimonas sp. SE-A11]MDM4770225.1 hypothetical protein [Solimonas sp. SE-A11]
MRAHVLKLRLSAEELERARARAGDEPLAVWLRQLAVDGEAVAPRRRLVRERPLHPQAAELTRAAVLAGNQLRQIADALADAPDLYPQPTELLAALARIDAALRQTLELTDGNP